MLVAASPNWEVWMSKGTLELSNTGRNGAMGIEGENNKGRLSQACQSKNSILFSHFWL